MGKGKPRTNSVRICTVCYRDLTNRAIGNLVRVTYGGNPNRFKHKDCTIPDEF